ncbi:MAG TPA: hypothetical protein VFB38_00270 [Chthonomonadaceae bacterium]|nr:hypothetical protein [Chthonomonadaceae bacterium]
MPARAYYRKDLMERMSSQFPIWTILIDTGEDENHTKFPQLHFQDLTAAIHHDGKTRLFHIMYDHNLNQAKKILGYMEKDFPGLYSQLLDAETEYGATNVLNLPDIPTAGSVLKKSMKLIQGTINKIRRDYLDSGLEPGTIPCSTCMLTPSPESNLSVALGAHTGDEDGDHNLKFDDEENPPAGGREGAQGKPGR